MAFQREREGLIMLAIERRNEILEKLQMEKRVVVSELSQVYQVSEETIRRDLEKLTRDGFAIKSYGGAVMNENNNIDLPFNIRKNTNVSGKQRIAGLIKNMVCDGERLMLDASSTAVFIAKALKEKKGLTLITNSIEILVELFDRSEWHVMSTGGIAKEGSLRGVQTDKMLNSYYVDKAIISCKGFDLKAGFTDSDEMHAKNKYTMLQNAAEKILVVDSSKFDRLAFAKIIGPAEIDTIVTDEQPNDAYLQLFEELEVNCVYPEVM